MDINFPKDPKQLRKFNMMRYGSVPPSWELIEKVVRKSGLKMLSKFEYAWLMPRSTLTWYKTGVKNLPAKYWHIFYEFEVVGQKYSKLKSKTKMTSDSTYILKSNKQIINGSKQNANGTR